MFIIHIGESGYNIFYLKLFLQAASATKLYVIFTFYSHFAQKNVLALFRRWLTPINIYTLLIHLNLRISDAVENGTKNLLLAG